MPAGFVKNEKISKVSPLNEEIEECKNDGDTHSLLGAKPEGHRWSLRNHVHEPTLFFFMLAFALTMNCDTNLYMDRACVSIFNRTKEECSGNDTHLSDQLQKFASKYLQYSVLIRLLPSWILGFFIGSWSDKYGKKPIIYVCLIGTILSSLGMVLFVAESTIPIYTALIMVIPAGFTGGIISILSCLYTMASESTRDDLRTIKYAALQVSVTLSMPLGVLISGQLFGAFGYVPVYVLSCVCYVISVVWFFFFVKDEGVRTKACFRTMLRDFFKCDRLKDSVAVAFKKRGRNGRAEILLLCFSMCVVVLSYVAVAEIMYLFCKRVFHWSLTYYSNVNTVGSVSSGLFLIVFVPILHKVWGISDLWIGLIGCVTIMAQLGIKAFSIHPWTYFVALAVDLPSSTATMAIRSRLSKIIDKSELGMVFSVLAIMESFVPVIGTLMVTEVYNASVEFFPGLIMLVAAICMVFPIIVLIWMIYKGRSMQEEPRGTKIVSEESPPEEPVETKTGLSYVNGNTNIND